DIIRSSPAQSLFPFTTLFRSPVPGLDIALEDVEKLSSSGVTATVAALSRLIEGGDPNLKNEAWVPHRPARPEKSEGGIEIRMERSEEHTSELQSRENLVCRLL